MELLLFVAELLLVEFNPCDLRQITRWEFVHDGNPELTSDAILAVD